MSWDGVVGSSGAWQELGQLGAELNDYRNGADSNEHIARASHLHDIGHARLGNADHHLIAQAMLNPLESAVIALRQAMRGHFSPEEGAEPTGLADVEAGLDAFAVELSKLPLPAAGLVVDSRVAIDEMRRDVDEALSGAQQAEGELRERLNELSDQLSSLNNEDLVTLQNDFDALSTKIDATTADLTEQAQQSLRAFEEQAEEIIDEITDNRDRAQDLLGEIGRTGLTEGYSQWEETEKDSANNWRSLTVVFGVISALTVAGLVALHTWVEPTDGSNWGIALGAVSIPAAFGTIARYCSKQSRLHRNNAVTARRVALELASLGAYLEPLPDEDKEELTIKLVSAYFGRAIQLGDDHEMDNWIEAALKSRRDRKVAETPA